MRLIRALTVLTLATSILATSALTAQAGTLSQAATPAKPSRVLVRLKGSTSPIALSALAHSAETSSGTVREIASGRYSWRVPTGRSAEQFASDLQASGRVQYAVPDYEREVVAYTPPAYAIPNDPDFSFSKTGASYYRSSKGKSVLVASYPYGRSWALREIRAPQAWAQGYTGADIIGKYPLRAGGMQVTVAVIDSGLYATHPDNAANVVGGHDFAQQEQPDGTFTQDDDVTPVSQSAVGSRFPYARRVLTVAHGTCVSGEIGATVNNGVGTVGVGYDTRVVVHKVMGLSRQGTATIRDSAVVEAIIYSANSGAKVINLSIGGYDYSPAIADAIDYAYGKGCVIVAAKGNDATRKPFYPASNKHVISVGALDKNAKAVTIPADYTNYAKTSLDIMAPGSFMWGLNKPDINLVPDLTAQSGYYLWDGTSMAAPVVSGAVAWIWRAAPALSNAEITNEILGSAPRGAKSKRFPSGYRKLDMAAAYARLKSDYPLLAKPAMADQTVAALGPMPVSWAVPLSNLRGVTYRYSLDNIPAGTTDQPGANLWFNPGDTLISVTAHSSYNWDDGTATSQAWLHVVPSASGTSTLDGAHVAGSSATLATPGYGAGVAIDATLRDSADTRLAGATVWVQSSTDGLTFSDLAAETNLPQGVYRAMVAPKSRTWYRAAFSGQGAITAANSDSVLVVPGVSLSRPASKSSISHNKRLALNGKLMPSHSSSSRTVKLQIKRWNGRRWADYSTAWTRVTRRNSVYATYAATLGLKKGAYRIYAYAPADDAHSATTSGYRAVSVK